MRWQFLLSFRRHYGLPKKAFEDCLDWKWFDGKLLKNIIVGKSDAWYMYQLIYFAGKCTAGSEDDLQPTERNECQWEEGPLANDYSFWTFAFSRSEPKKDSIISSFWEIRRELFTLGFDQDFGNTGSTSGCISITSRAVSILSWIN